MTTRPTRISAGHIAGATRSRAASRACLRWLPGACLLAALPLAAVAAPRVEVENDGAACTITWRVDGREAFVYRYGSQIDLPHLYPVRSPSGRPLTVQQTEPYPHHRSVWFADTVALAGKRQASFYNALYSRDAAASAFVDHIRHVGAGRVARTADSAAVTMRLVWEMDGSTPVLDETRRVRVRALGRGEYLVDLCFTVKAAYGDVEFRSDVAHYAWPYVRMAQAFSVDRGGIITSSEGGANQRGTDGKPARWVDYSGGPDGITEGLAIFSHPSNEHPHTWLTRDYGTFGPRRAGERNGKRFVLPRGRTLSTRVALLVHAGGPAEGRVFDRYAQYGRGEL